MSSNRPKSSVNSLVRPSFLDVLLKSMFFTACLTSFLWVFSLLHCSLCTFVYYDKLIFFKYKALIRQKFFIKLIKFFSVFFSGFLLLFHQCLKPIPTYLILKSSIFPDLKNLSKIFCHLYSSYICFLYRYFLIFGHNWLIHV